MICRAYAETPPPGEKPLDEIHARIKPWHTFNPDWVREASLIVQGNYRSGGYPCIFFPNGSSVMIRQSTFTELKALKGDLSRTDVDVNLSGLDERRFPHSFLNNRTYLVFLKPTPESRARIGDPQAFFTLHTQLDGEERIAIIDLSQTQDEAEAVREQATRSATHKGFDFTPEKWAAFRDLPDIDLEGQKRFQSFIDEVVAAPESSLRQVRSYLGEPDFWYHNEDGVFYEYKLNRGAKNEAGKITGFVELGFSDRLQLSHLEIVYRQYVKDNVHGEYWQDASPPDLERLGLRNIKR